ncbi:uncharacterized protein LOC5504203 [Nematostella vectensis]|uniref:uncharacterized protein LOC5504203 n=1 Tax=Nematostella vectensis TaxID=45351 RepID=UPI0020771BE4|nr:uncharacterized protein LOC5504203 [Nematostella vectensis]
MTLFLALVLCFASLSSAAADSPIYPKEYQSIIGHGFATNWFKTPELLLKYHQRNIQDVLEKGFRNLRLRSRADLYEAPYNNTQFSWFLGNLTIVVDDCIKVGVVPIISWVHHKAEAFATEQDRINYVTWWKAVASTLKNKSYTLGFNLFTELGLDGCGNNCSGSLRENTTKYNEWTKEVTREIRETGGKNGKRILILASPEKTGKGLHKIDKRIYENDAFMMAEWHTYASGPNKESGGAKYWTGDGIPEGRANVQKFLEEGVDFTKKSKVLTYLGAWMPTDNKDGSLTQTEVINFGRYFVGKLKRAKIPWSLNVLDSYYDTEKCEWLTDIQDIKGRKLNMSLVLENILDVMQSNVTQPSNGASRNAQALSTVLFSCFVFLFCCSLRLK